MRDGAGSERMAAGIEHLLDLGDLGRIHFRHRRAVV
ncbi:hypothetical protein XHC_0758, partial [Xanthomonas hortorum pv. carotae str. M081]